MGLTSDWSTDCTVSPGGRGSPGGYTGATVSPGGYNGAIGKGATGPEPSTPAFQAPEPTVPIINILTD